MQHHILIIGAGEIGSALGAVLQECPQNEVQYWDNRPSCLKGKKRSQNLPEAIKSGKLLFFCTPTAALPGVLEASVSHMTRSSACIFLSKGIYPKTKETTAMIAERLLPSKVLRGFLGGPLLAEELNFKQAGLGVLATASPMLSSLARRVFRDSQVKLETTSDIPGVAWCGILKNIYAMGAGMLDGLHLGANMRGWYVTQTLMEMKDLVEYFGGSKETADGAAGIGDFMATAFCPYSKNRMFGVQFVLGRSRHGEEGEGFFALPVLLDLLGARKKSFTLLCVLQYIVSTPENAEQIFSRTFWKKK